MLLSGLGDEVSTVKHNASKLYASRACCYYETLTMGRCTGALLWTRVDLNIRIQFLTKVVRSTPLLRRYTYELKFTCVWFTMRVFFKENSISASRSCFLWENSSPWCYHLKNVNDTRTLLTCFPLLTQCCSQRFVLVARCSRE